MNPTDLYEQIKDIKRLNPVELEAMVLKHEQQIKDLAAHLLELKQLVTPMMEFKQPLTEDDDLNNVRYKAKYRYETKQPLTDAEIYECYRSKFGIMLTDSGAQNTIKQFARAIERAHGIGVEDE